MMRNRTLWFGLFLFLGVLFLAPSAEAHAEYVTSSPQKDGIVATPPSSVNITFTETVQLGSADIRVTNASGSRFDRGAPTLSEDRRTARVTLESVEPGLYRVRWVVVSAVDGHPTNGLFEFAVQDPNGSVIDLPNSPTDPGAPVSPVEIGFRYVGFVGLALALGSAVLAALIWLPAGRDPDARETAAYAPGLRTILHWGRVGAFAFGAGMVGLWFQLQGLDSGLSAESLLGSLFLLSVLGRGILAAALFVLLSAAFAHAGRITSGDGRHLRLALVLALAAIAVGALGTHAAANQSFGPLGTAADAVHVAGAALWVGGLAGIVAVRGFLRDPAASSLARHVYARFSRLAGYAVGLVLGGGGTLALLLVGSWEALLGTAYGWVVLAKIGLFAPMIASGAYNRYRLLPSIAEAKDTPGTIRGLSRNVRLEWTLGAVVLALAAVLTAMVPAVTTLAPSGPFIVQGTAGGIRMELHLLTPPAGPGTYAYSLYVFNATTGAVYNDARDGSGVLTVRLGNDPVGATVNLSGPHGHHFFGDPLDLSQPGAWRIDARLTRGDGVEVQTSFYITIREGA